MTMMAANPSDRAAGATNKPSIFAMVKSSVFGGLDNIGIGETSGREPNTRLTDAQDRARLRALALVGAGLLVVTMFIWLQLAVGALP